MKWIYSTNDLAEILNLSRQRINIYIMAGKIKPDYKAVKKNKSYFTKKKILKIKEDFFNKSGPFSKEEKTPAPDPSDNPGPL